MSGAGAAPPARPQIILSFDFGARRMGVSVGDTLTQTARGLKTLDCRTGAPWDAIDELVTEYRPARFVLGLPLSMDGAPTALTDATRAFGRDLKARYGAPVALVDERLSSREAEDQLRAARAAGLKRRR
ncbi:MAG TPA: Holliday junction resolvase RuvX, partial [Steroidobacter sp.]|nr:Holliday junction resolvase RuvX [Steroidobacter sp.]